MHRHIENARKTPLTLWDLFKWLGVSGVLIVIGWLVSIFAMPEKVDALDAEVKAVKAVCAPLPGRIKAVEEDVEVIMEEHKAFRSEQMVQTKILYEIKGKLEAE